MAKQRKEPERPHMLSALDALIELNTIDRLLDVYRKTAPRAFDAMGRDAFRRACQPTCVGPVPRLTTEQWSAMSQELTAKHVEMEMNAKGERGD